MSRLPLLVRLLALGLTLAAPAACSSAKDRTAHDRPDGGAGGDGGMGGACACDADARACDLDCGCDARCGGSEVEQACRIAADCASGLDCRKGPGDETGVCLQRCTAIGDGTCDGSRDCIPTEEEGQDLNGNGRRDFYCVQTCPVDEAESTCGPGRACYVTTLGGGVCLDEAGDGEAGYLEPCDGQFACADGLFCPAPEDDGDARLCIQLCDPTGRVLPDCGQGLECALGDDPENDGVGICIETCSSVVENDCTAGSTCIPSGGDDAPRICVPGGEVAAGQPCTEFAGQCAAGLVCFGRCTKPCNVRLGAGAGCPAGEACLGNPDGAFGLCIRLCADPFGDGCGPGGTCVPFGLQGYCFPAGTRAAGEACNDVGQCAAQHICEGGICKALCDGEHPCAGGAECVASGGIGVGLCSAPCDDVFGGTGCPGELVCRVQDIDGSGSCGTAGEGNHGQRCGDGSDCGVGQACVDLEAAGQERCHALCNPAAAEGEPHRCPEGLACLVPEGGTIGGCGIPANAGNGGGGN